MTDKQRIKPWLLNIGSATEISRYQQAIPLRASEVGASSEWDYDES